MRNLVLFLLRHHIFILFLTLEAVSFYLIIINNRYHNATVFNSTNQVTGSIYKYYSEVTEYLHLKKSNQLLAAENARLMTSSALSYISYRDTVFSVNDTVYRLKYTFADARVINNSINKRNNYLTLDKGSLNGIKPEMGVIAPDGVVGIVKDVSPHFSSVMSVLNKNTTISCKVKKNGYFGSLIWEGGSPAIGTVKDVPKHAAIKKGDTLITSGASAIFPEGIVLATVRGFEMEEGGNFYNISVNLATDFGKLTYVYVIHNLLKDEQRELEAKNTDNEQR